MTVSGEYNFWDRILVLKITDLDGRVYELIPQQILGEPPPNNLNIIYEVKKVLRADPDPGLITIENAGPELRKVLAKPFDPVKKPGPKVEIFTGYRSEGVATLIYSGEVQEGVSRRQAPNIITKLRCGVDYHKYLNVLQSKSFGKGTNVLDALKSIAKANGRDISWAKELVKKFKKRFINGRNFVDNLKAIFTEIAKEFDLSITGTDSGVIQVSELGYPNDDPVILLNESSGLLEAQITNIGVNIKALQQPRIRPGTLLDVQSFNTADYGRNFTAQSVTHTGDNWSTPNYTTIEAIFFPPRFTKAA